MNEPVVSYRAVARGSDRGLGLTFAAILCIVGLWPVLSGHQPRLLALSLAVVFLFIAIFRPLLLAPLNGLWGRFGRIVHSIGNPIVMGLVYSIAFVPIAIVLRLTGKDLLQLKRDPAKSSYWIVRDPPGPSTGSMSRQF